MLINVGDLLTESIDLYKEHWKSFLQYSFWAAIPMLALNFLFAQIIAEGFTGPTGFLYLVAYIIAAVLSTLINIAFLRTIAAVYTKKSVRNIKEEILGAKKLLLPAIGAYILTGLATIGGLFLLVIPGIIFMVWFIFAGHAVAIDGKKAMDAMKFSKKILNGNWWAVFGRFLVIAIIVGLIVGIAQGLLAAPFSAASSTVDLYATTLIGGALGILTAPFATGAMTILYLDAKKKMNQKNEAKKEA